MRRRRAVAAVQVGRLSTSAPSWALWVVAILALPLWPVSPASSAGSPTVANDVPVTAVDLSESRSNNSPAMAVDPTDGRFVVLASRVDAPAFGCTLHVSGDGGRGWIEVVPVRTLPTGVERCYAPEVAFAADGTLYMLFVGLVGLGNKPVGAYLTTSRNRGRSFGTPRQVLGEESFGVRMAVDRTDGGGRIYLVWIAAGAPTASGGFVATVPNPIMAKYSDDGGTSFSPATQVSDPGRERVVAPAVAVGPDHTVHVLYYDLGDDARDYQGLDGPIWEEEWSLVMASSVSGRPFDTGVVVDNTVVPPERAMLIFTMPPPTVAAAADGRVYAAWHDARNGDWDVFLRRSNDGGRTWADAVRLNDDILRNRRHQYQPRLDVAPNGRVDAVFYDRRDDPENVDNDVMYTSSSDGGISFSPNRKLTETASNTEVGARYPIPSAAGLIEYGSGPGLLANDDAALAAWTDTRNSPPGEQQDIFATEVRFSSRPKMRNAREGPPPAVGFAAGLTFFGIAAFGAMRLRRARRDEAGEKTT